MASEYKAFIVKGKNGALPSSRLKGEMEFVVFVQTTSQDHKAVVVHRIDRFQYVQRDWFMPLFILLHDILSVLKCSL